MASAPQKRLSPYGEDEMPVAKRARMAPDAQPADLAMPDVHDTQETSSQPTTDPAAIGLPNMAELARGHLRRSIALVLKEVGFDSTSGPSLERLTEMSEEYLESMCQEIKMYQECARRNQPIPTDFDLSLKRFNIGTGMLRPHVRNPISRHKKHLLQPKYIIPSLADIDECLRGLPLLGEELSGHTEKAAKEYIPSSFPDFPSIHTYKATPQFVDEVTVQGTGLKWSDGEPITDGTPSAAAYEDALWQKGDGGALRMDPRRLREAAARESKQAEEALRGVVRASKINTLKEARLAAQRSKLSRNRYEYWEDTMRELLEDSSRAAAKKALGATPPTANGTAARSEIADHSMIVNALKPTHRQEVSRAGKRAAKEGPPSK